MARVGCGVGANRVKLKIQDNPRPDDGHGGQDNESGAWVDKFEVWAMMKKTSGREIFSNRQTETRSLYRFTMDFPLGGKTVLPTDRILIGTRQFNIHSIDIVGERNKTLVVIAEEGISD